MAMVYQKGKAALSLFSLKCSTTGVTDVNNKFLLPNRERISWGILGKDESAEIFWPWQYFKLL